MENTNNKINFTTTDILYALLSVEDEDSKEILTKNFNFKQLNDYCKNEESKDECIDRWQTFIMFYEMLIKAIEQFYEKLHDQNKTISLDETLDNINKIYDKLDIDDRKKLCANLISKPIFQDDATDLMIKNADKEFNADPKTKFIWGIFRDIFKNYLKQGIGYKDYTNV